MLATCEDARRQIAAMPEWKQRWLEQYMGFNGKPPKNSERPPLPPPPPPMSSDYTHSRILELERVLDEEWVQEDDTIGFVPPPPPARRAVAQSARATAVNVQISEQALRLAQTTGMSFSDAMDGLMRAAQAGWLESTQTASAKPAQKQPPSTDLTKRPKRKIALE